MRKANGQYKSMRLYNILGLVTVITYIVICVYLLAKPQIKVPIHLEKQPARLYDLTEQRIKDEIKEMSNTTDGITWYENGKQVEKTYIASVSKYSRADSCHNKRGDKCLTAAGRDTTAGETVACPRNYKLGAHVTIDGHVYTCDDRTAQWVQKRFGDTFDIFTENQNEAKQFGRQSLVVNIK